jgi:hypothetical protein
MKFIRVLPQLRFQEPDPRVLQVVARHFQTVLRIYLVRRPRAPEALPRDGSTTRVGREGYGRCGEEDKHH